MLEEPEGLEEGRWLPGARGRGMGSQCVFSGDRLSVQKMGRALGLDETGRVAV